MGSRKFCRTMQRVFAVGIVAGVLLLCWACGVSRFSAFQGARTFYLDSLSSQARRTQILSVKDLGKIRGESVQLEGVPAETLMEALGAELLFVEESAGVRSYYCYTDEWADGVQIGEYYVNLQIAERADGCVAGAPMIFGGF